MAQIYANENFPLPVVQKLRELGHDVLTIQETGRADQALPDDQVLSFAINGQRALLTINRRHFIRLHQQNSQHEGIIVCTLDSDFAGQARRIHLAISNLASLKNQLIRVNRPPKSSG